MPTFKKGRAPAPNCGRMARKTAQIRPKSGLPEETEAYIRRLRRDGMTIDDIADFFDLSKERVELAVATVRTPAVAPTRATINGTLAGHQFLTSEAHPNEPKWMTLDRIIEELVDRRAGRI